MGMEMNCPEHNVDVPVETSEVHGSQIVHRGWCPEDEGHEAEVVEW